MFLAASSADDESSQIHDYSRCLYVFAFVCVCDYKSIIIIPFIINCAVKYMYNMHVHILYTQVYILCTPTLTEK